jgi:hypothetical protein
MAAAKTWRRLKGHNQKGHDQLPKVIDGVIFHDGMGIEVEAAKSPALFTPSPACIQ